MFSSALDASKNNHSSGPDGILARLLYTCRFTIVFPVFLLFKRSLDEGIVPDVWKTCSITPIFKSGDPTDVSNYRPIYIIPHLAKLLESIVYSYIKRSANYILPDSQHGFRPGKSTITNSISFSSYILNVLTA